MHIPDGFLSLPVGVGSALLSTAGIGGSLRLLNKPSERRSIPLIGVSAAFIFAAQMINFPIPGGTSGHLVGGVLAAILLGPVNAVAAMTSVILIQCLLFADGGLTALGANLFNMALLSPIAGYWVYRLIAGTTPSTSRQTIAVATAGWVSTILTAGACSGQLALSGIANPQTLFSTMLLIHAIIGIGEGLITAFIIQALRKMKALDADLKPFGASQGSRAPNLLFALLIAGGFALSLSPFASQLPDGLEKAAILLGFEQAQGENPAFPAPLPDYQVSGAFSPAASTGLAGLLGALAVMTAIFLFGKILPTPVPVSDPSPQKPC